jgi:hypothetical protein
MPLKSLAKTALLAALAGGLAGLGGCGFDDVQLNGKIFDAMGLNTGSVKSAEPKVAARQPLVVPPGLESLPPPGSGKAEQPSLADIQDPDALKKVSKADLERQQAEYCKKNYYDALARGDASADSAAGPLGSCHPSVFTAIKKWTSGSDDDASGDSQDQ